MKKNILAFCPIFYPHMGGAERTVYELYTRLVKKYGWKVFLVTLNIENAPRYENVGGIEVFRVGRAYKNKVVKFIMFQVLFLCIYFRKFLFKKIDILHIHYGFPLSPVAILMKYFSRMKLVISEYHLATGADIYSYEQNPGYVNKIAGFVYKKADLVLTISQDNREFIKKFSGVDKAEVIKQGTDHVFFSPKYFDENKRKELLADNDFVLVTTSRISHRKNIEDMIKAVKILSDNNIKVSLIINGKVDRGNNEYYNQLEKLISEFGIQDKVFFQGFVSDEELRTIYASSDVFLLTSKYEGFGIVNVEAMASGLPVITYDTGAARDFINGDNGMVADENTPQALVDKILPILKNSELLQKMKQEARKCVETELNWDRYAEENDKYLESLYERV